MVITLLHCVGWLRESMTMGISLNALLFTGKIGLKGYPNKDLINTVKNKSSSNHIVNERGPLLQSDLIRRVQNPHWQTSGPQEPKNSFWTTQDHI